MLARRFTKHTRQKPVILIGEYGQGKTGVCGALGAALAGEFLSDPAHSPVPVVIPLGELHDIYHIDEAHGTACVMIPGDGELPQEHPRGTVCELSNTGSR